MNLKAFLSTQLSIYRLDEACCLIVTYKKFCNQLHLLHINHYY